MECAVEKAKAYLSDSRIIIMAFPGFISGTGDAIFMRGRPIQIFCKMRHISIGISRD